MRLFIKSKWWNLIKNTFLLPGMIYLIQRCVWSHSTKALWIFINTQINSSCVRNEWHKLFLFAVNLRYEAHISGGWVQCVCVCVCMCVNVFTRKKIPDEIDTELFSSFLSLMLTSLFSFSLPLAGVLSRTPVAQPFHCCLKVITAVYVKTLWTWTILTGLTGIWLINVNRTDPWIAPLVCKNRFSGFHILVASTLMKI